MPACAHVVCAQFQVAPVLTESTCLYLAGWLFVLTVLGSLPLFLFTVPGLLLPACFLLAPLQRLPYHCCAMVSSPAVSPNLVGRGGRTTLECMVSHPCHDMVVLYEV